MPIVPSWTEGRRAVEDLGALIDFRLAAVRGRSRARLRVAWIALALFTAGMVVVPAWLSGVFLSGSETASLYLPTPDQVRGLLPEAFTGFLLVAIGGAIATGGGREMVSRDRGVAFPISPATDHLGALLLAPLSAAWMFQAWLLLGASAYAGGWSAVAGVPLVLAYVVLATAVAQVIGWWMEVLRRGPAGVLLSRLVVAGLAVVAGALLTTGTMRPVIDAIPTRSLAEATLGFGPSWFPHLVAELVLVVVAVGAGLAPARIAARRPQREELRLDGGVHRPRPVETGTDGAWRDLALLLRIDRTAVWRSVPLRRGTFVIVLLPGLGSLAADLAWHQVVILPGLVASGVALLYGVNAWSLDGRGALWRESLPLDPRLSFLARSAVLVELIALSTVVTVLLAAVRAGRPSAAAAVALLCCAVVSAVQVVATSAVWSIRSPYAVDLRSARMIPAPPATMLAYSTKLAVTCSLTGLLFSALSRLSIWQVAPVLAVLFLAWSLTRLARARRRWSDPRQRARVIATVAA